MDSIRPQITLYTLPTHLAYLLLVLLIAPWSTVAGETVDSPRIISLSVAADRLLEQLDATDHVIGFKQFPANDPGAVYPYVDSLLRLRPSLVILPAGEQYGRLQTVLRPQGISIYEFSPYTLEERLHSYQQLGELIGFGPEAERLVQQLIQGLADISASNYGWPRPEVAVVTRGENLFTEGSDSIVTNLIEVAGGENVLEQFGSRRVRVTLAMLEASAPDVILDATGYEEGSAARQQAEDFWSGLPWIKRFGFLPASILQPTGREMIDGALLIQVQLFPNRFPPSSVKAEE